MVIIEAKANGIPAISTNWGDAVYEVIENIGTKEKIIFWKEMR